MKTVRIHVPELDLEANGNYRNLPENVIKDSDRLRCTNHSYTELHNCSKAVSYDTTRFSS